MDAFEPFDLLRHAVEVGQVCRDRDDVDAVGVPEPGRRLVQAIFVAGDENEVQPALRDRLGKRRAQPVRTAGDERVRSVGLRELRRSHQEDPSAGCDLGTCAGV